MTMQQLKQKIETLLEQYYDENNMYKVDIVILKEIQQVLNELEEPIEHKIDMYYTAVDAASRIQLLYYKQ